MKFLSKINQSSNHRRIIIIFHDLQGCTTMLVVNELITIVCEQPKITINILGTSEN